MTSANPAENGLTPAPEAPTATGYPFRKLLISVLLFALFWLGFWAVLFVAIAQFILRAFDSDASGDLARFGGRLGLYLGEIVGYITFARDTAPFPFSAFPKA